VAQHEEWEQQVRLAQLLNRWADSSCTFWTAVDTVARSATAGAMRRLRGVRPGTPDTLVLYRGKLVALELKSRRGQCSRSQRLAREALSRAGASGGCAAGQRGDVALRKSGVLFRTIV
jgi:hypothetical protein